MNPTRKERCFFTLRENSGKRGGERIAKRRTCARARAEIEGKKGEGKKGAFEYEQKVI
jgi:hypothetical protein